MNYRTPAISQDNLALHRALGRHDRLNAEAALLREIREAWKNALSRFLQTLKRAISLRPSTFEQLRSRLDIFFKPGRLTAVAHTATETRKPLS